MLPQSFRIPGRRHAYVDLQDVFNMYGLTGRFRDWVRRSVKPLLAGAVIEYDKEGTDPREKNYAIAEANAIAVIATLPEDKRRLPTPAPEPVAAPATRARRHVQIRIPIHGLSHNAMYEHTSFGANRTLRRTAEYNEWAEVFKSYLPGKPSWLKKSTTTHVDIKFGLTAPHDTENLMKSAIDTVFSTWRMNDNGVRSGSFASELVRSKRDGYILIDISQQG